MATDEETETIRDLKRKTVFAGLLTLPIMLLAFDSMIPGLSFDSILAPAIQRWLEFILATPVILWAGGIFFTRGWPHPCQSWSAWARAPKTGSSSNLSSQLPATTKTLAFEQTGMSVPF